MSIPSTKGERIKKLRSACNLTQTELANKIGVSKQTLYKYENNIITNIPSDKIELLALFLNTSEAYLMGWAKDSLAKDSSIFDIPGIMPLPKTYTVPLLGNIACGDPILAEQNIADWVPVPDSVKNADFALTCQGDSMINARIFDGDIVYIRQQSDVDDGEIAAVLIGEEATLKRVYKMPGRLQLRAENPSFPPINLEGEDLENVRILGKAVAFTSAVR